VDSQRRPDDQAAAAAAVAMDAVTSGVVSALCYRLIS